MRRQAENKKAALLSICLHIIIVCIGMLTTIVSRPHQNLVFMDVDVIGEGELGQPLQNTPVEEPAPPAQPTPPPTPSEQPNPEPTPEPTPPVTEQVQPNIPNTDNDAEPLPPSEEDQLQHIKELIAENDKPLQVEEYPPVEQEEPILEQPEENKMVEPEVVETPDKQVEEPAAPDPVPEEPETILPPPKKEQPIEKKPPKKSRAKKKAKARKRLLSVLKKVEKEQAKQKARKKIKQLASEALKQQRKDDAFDKMLNESASSLSQARGGTGSKGRGIGNSGSGLGVSDDDCRMISSQITPHWIVPSGVKDVENIVVEVEIQLSSNGTVLPSAVRIIDQQRYKIDAAFRAAADSTKRAILAASPLRIPKEKAHLFQKFIFRFNLKEALGG